MKNNIKVKLGKILFIIFMPIVLVCISFLFLIQVGNMESLQVYFWYIGVIGLAASVPALIGARIMDKSLKSGIRVRAIVISRGDTGATGVVSGNVVFETEQGEAIALRANMIEYNALLENDVGILHYKPIPDKITKFVVKMLGHNKDEQENHFVKFEGEGKSANPSGTKADEQCKNCGAVIHYNRFSTRTACEHCAGNDKSTAQGNRHKNPLLSKIGHFIMVASGVLFVLCIGTTVMMLLGRSYPQQFFWHIVGFGTMIGAILFAMFILGAILWHRALPVVKERAFVESRGKLGAFLGEIVFETEQKESVSLQVEEDAYKSICEGDVGILHYKLDAKNLKLFKKFEREGKSITLSDAADKHCRNCGAAVHIEKHKFATRITCEYCGFCFDPD